MRWRVTYDEVYNKKGSKKNKSKLNSLILYGNLSFVIRTLLDNAYSTIQSHYMWRKQISINKTNTSTMKNLPWLSADVQARIEPSQISLIKAGLEGLQATNIIKFNILRHPSQSTSETYKIYMYTLNDGQPEELFALLRNWKIRLTEPARLFLQARLVIHVRCSVEKVLDNLKN